MGNNILVSNYIRYVKDIPVMLLVKILISNYVKTIRLLDNSYEKMVDILGSIEDDEDENISEGSNSEQDEHNMEYPLTKKTFSDLVDKLILLLEMSDESLEKLSPNYYSSIDYDSIKCISTFDKQLHKIIISIINYIESLDLISDDTTGDEFYDISDEEEEDLARIIQALDSISNYYEKLTSNISEKFITEFQKYYKKNSLNRMKVNDLTYLFGVTLDYNINDFFKITLDREENMNQLVLIEMEILFYENILIEILELIYLYIENECDIDNDDINFEVKCFFEKEDISKIKISESEFINYLKILLEFEGFNNFGISIEEDEIKLDVFIIFEL